MKNKNTAIVKNTVCIMLILAVFFCPLCGYTNTAFADDGELFTCDCPDCTDGTNTITTVEDCTANGCVDGVISTIISSTCATCGGDNIVTNTTYTTCSACSGNGYTVVTSGNYWKVSSCTTCGGTTYVVSYSKSADTSSSAVTAYLNSFSSYIGTGTIVTTTSSTCINCTDGNTYTVVDSTCLTCGGDGEVTTQTTIDCPTCLGAGIIIIDITDISNISTVVTTEDADMTVTFSYSETGDVGDLEFIWYLSNNAYQVTYSPSVTLTGLPIGIYTMQCTINSSVGFSKTTNTFEVWVNPASTISYISITEQPSSYTIKQGQAVSISLDEETATNVSWYCNDEISLCDSYIYDLSALEIGEYDIYCIYTLDDEEITSETASITVVNESGLSSDEVIEGIETATENMSTGFWVAIGAGLATALLAWIVSRRNKS